MSSIAQLKTQAVMAAKQLWYGSRGEPIILGGHTLRYLVGSRPVRLKYASGGDGVARNDAKQMRYFLDHVQPGQLVLDVGAHRGQYAVLFAALVGPHGHVISFEPDVDARPLLRQNVALNSFQERVVVEDWALFDATESRELYARHGNSQSSLARAGLGGSADEHDMERYTVRTIRLDEYLRDAALPAPDYVKLDVEGAEINVLRGSRNVLASKAVVLCELHPYAWKEFGTSFDDLLAIVDDSERTMTYLDEELRIEDGPTYGAVLIS
jgi:FkbM family methyltransferase